MSKKKRGHMQKNGGVITADLTDFILRRNKEQPELFCDPKIRSARQQYRRDHPTEIFVQKCMDGRLNLSTYTEMPPGILQPFRNIGGRFDLGWPFYQEVIKESVLFAQARGRRCRVLATYHFSKGDPERGCAGWGYDTNAAKKAAASPWAAGAKSGWIYRKFLP